MVVAREVEGLKRWTAEEVDDLLRAGLLRDSDRYELLYGQLVEKMSKGQPHNAATLLVTRALQSVFGGEYLVVGGISLKGLAIESEPEPDVVVLRGDMLEIARRNPRVDEIDIVVEIADSSLAKDIRDKTPLYAELGLREYWIIDLNHRQVRVHRDPIEGEWTQIEIVREEGHIELASGRQLALTAILPPQF